MLELIYFVLLCIGKQSKINTSNANYYGSKEVSTFALV